jgi:hypothetical protein
MPDIDAMEVVERFCAVRQRVIGTDQDARYRTTPDTCTRRRSLCRAILSLLQQDGVPESAVSLIAARALYRYESRDRRIAYSDLPIDRLSSASRGIRARRLIVAPESRPRRRRQRLPCFGWREGRERNLACFSTSATQRG